VGVVWWETRQAGARSGLVGAWVCSVVWVELEWLVVWMELAVVVTVGGLRVVAVAPASTGAAPATAPTVESE